MSGRLKLVQLPPNRVRRNYRGGAGLDRLRGNPDGRDGDRPEEWIASLVPARNPGLSPIPDEGYSVCLTKEGEEKLLIELLREDPGFYLGERHVERHGPDLGFLVKLLDSSMRLHVQAHPTADFAQRYLNSKYGKLECYYILQVREGAKPYIRLGFQHPPARAEWKRIIEQQDIAAMDACFEPVPVEAGQVWYIPGGMPHAIGEQILMLEIMEPSDLVVRCEFEREGVTVPPEARFMGKGLDFCLDIFDYNGYSVGEITRKHKVAPVLLREEAGCRLERLIGPDVSSCFEVQRLQLGRGGRAVLPGGLPQPHGGLFRSGRAVMPGGTPQIALVTKGSAKLCCGEENVELRRGDSLFVAAAAGEFAVEALSGSGEETELCFVKPGLTPSNEKERTK